MADKKLIRQKSLATLVDYKRTFSTPHGKKVLWDIMKNSGMLGTSFVINDPYSTCYNEGTRAAALEILKKLNTNIKKLEIMIERGHEADDNDNIFGESVE